MVAIYRHFDKSGNLLYVGISKNPSKRNYTHLTTSWWRHYIDHIEVGTWYPDFDSAHKAEKEAIASELPIFNDRHVPKGTPPRAMPYLKAHRQKPRMLWKRGPITLVGIIHEMNRLHEPKTSLGN